MNMADYKVSVFCVCNIFTLSHIVTLACIAIALKKPIFDQALWHYPQRFHPPIVNSAEKKIRPKKEKKNKCNKIKHLVSKNHSYSRLLIR